MKSEKGKQIFVSCILLFSMLLPACIDQFYPQIEGFHPVLVVDALITDKNEAYYCRLFNSVADTRKTPVKVSGATVEVRDDLGNNYLFKEKTPGVYRSDSLSFRGEAGRTYTLSIRTKNGDEYESEPSKMFAIPEIDSLYFGKDSETDDFGVLHEGIRIYFDSDKPSDGKYLRWTYEEWWKTHVPLPPLFRYVDENNIVPVLEPDNVICWRNYKSREIFTVSPDADITNRFIKKPLLFIASDKADRLMVQYYIKVRQYTISKNEYEFWEQMKQVNTAGGDIFDRQPFQIISNVHNVSNPSEPVLGYFQVSAVSESSMYITRREIDALDLRQFDYGCDVLFVNPRDQFPGKPEKPVTWTQMYYILLDEGYIFTDYLADYSYGGPGLIFLVFAKDYCSDCTVTANPNKPDFWVDLQ